MARHLLSQDLFHPQIRQICEKRAAGGCRFLTADYIPVVVREPVTNNQPL
jgi:hypothetical protein